MTLLRRAPREVYRVYDEEEFLAGEAWIECPQSACPDTEERDGGGARARHLAVAAMLCGAVGAVGAVIVISSLPPANGSRRVVASLRATVVAPVLARASRTRIWQARTVANAPGRESRQGSPRAAAGSRPSQVQARREIPGSPRQADVAIEVDVPPSADARPVTASSAAEPSAVEPATTASSATASSAGRSARAEFGFEQ
jgi:hypothetical protein